MTVHLLFLALVGLTLLSPRTNAADKPLKVFILAGQSNMQGHAKITTFDSLADDPKTAPLLKEMRTADGKPKVCDKVWITSVGCLGDAYTDLREKTGKLTVGYGAPGDKIGPEYTFGITLEKILDQPILLIKTSWGGRSLHTDFRSPSAGPYQWSDAELAQHKKRGDNLEKMKADKIQATGKFYRHMVEHVQKVLKDIKRVVPDYDEKQGYELAGFIWFQGFNDMVSSSPYEKRNQPGGFDLYAELLAHFIRDVRKDLSAPNLPVVIGVMGISGEKDGNKGAQQHFREAQRKVAQMPDFKANVLAVETAPFWDDELEALQQRQEKMNNQLNQEFKKQPTLSAAAKNKMREDAIATTFKPEEWKRFQLGVSNGGYHYMGAAKILGPIGKAFAEGVLQLHPKQ